MKHPDTVSGIFWLCMGILLSLWSTAYRIGDIAQPGPGFLPLLLGILLILLSLVLLIQARKSSHAAEATPASSLLRAGWQKVLYTVSLMVLATFLFEPLGYLLTFFLMMILLIRSAGPQRWWTTLLIAFFSVLSVYLIFVLLLKQPLPQGLLGI